jgi:hypothetical protein
MKRMALLVVVLLIVALTWTVSTYDTGRHQIMVVSYCWRF